MGKHHTQATRRSQMEIVKKEIVKLGGWIQLEKNLGAAHFTYYIAEILNCTKIKAHEYIDQAVQGSLARARIEQYHENKTRKS